MLKKLRWKFVGSAMIAVFTIVAMLSIFVNMWFYKIITFELDGTLIGIVNSEQMNLDPFRDGGFSGKGPFGSEPSPEGAYMTRYFSVTFEGDDVARVSREYIVSVDANEAVEYAEAVINRRSDFGFYKNYRYMISRDTDNDTTLVVFLNASNSQSAQRVLIIGCAAVSLLCMLVAFVIIFLLSKRAVDPYVRNIEQQKRFITDASHEIKTPLTSIAASADVLALDNEGNEWVENIQKQSQRLGKLVSNLVTLSRLDEEQPLPEQADFELSDVIWEIAEQMDSLAAAKERHFTKSIEDGLYMHGDSASVGQLVSVLLDNALKYSSEGGEIRLSAYKQHKDIVIEVYNTCHLSEPQNIDRLFDRFYRPDESRSSATGGNGIGLSIAKAIAEANRGSISASTSNGEDICFRVKFPALKKG